MKLLTDFLPILLFFIAYKMFDIYVATAVAIAATFLHVAVTWLKTRKVATMQLVTLAILVIFGGLTLYLHNEQFIKWKPTVINWIFGATFLGSQFFGEKTVVERLMSAQINLPNPIWRRLNLSWVAFFLIMGGANLYVMYNFDRDTWVNFKLFGMLGMTMVFLVIQSLFLSRHINVPEKIDSGE
ncbi:MAG: septation protein A [Desulfocapsaceae bacterium]|jgi:intracellular septation protein|nr:septation protein A [Desulfocapsaceae bacterium]